MQAVEANLWKQGYERVAGVDEVGVGPLAGPVVSAAIIFEPGSLLPGVNDSKKLAAAERSHLSKELMELAVSVGIGIATVAEIDKLNIYHASLLAMQRAVSDLKPEADYLLVDARRIPGVETPQEGLISGDARSFSIAAASIIAKTHRDQLMDDMGSVYPIYGFERHRGYPTPYHKDQIRKHGICPIHRKSFPVIAELTGSLSGNFLSLSHAVAKAVSPSQLDAVEAFLSPEASSLDPSERSRLRKLVHRRKRTLGLTVGPFLPFNSP
jgi:ribonuclease HII